MAGKDMELPNGKGSKKKAASKRQQAASPAAPAPDGGSPVEGEMAGELLAVPGPSGMCAGSSGSMPSVPAEESAAVELTAEEPVAAESPPAVSAVELEGVQPEASAVEPVGVELSVPAAQAAAAAPAAEAATTVRLVSEALSVLALGLAAAGKPTADCRRVCQQLWSQLQRQWRCRRQSRQRPWGSSQCWLMDQRQPRRSVGS